MGRYKLAIVTVINKDIIIAVDNVIYEDINCIKIDFQNSNSKYKSLGVFEKKNIDQTFLETKKHIGKRVIVNCWDPDEEPGKWSGNNWFKDIIPLVSHVIEKGACVKCGIYDHFVSYSQDFGKTWMHYEC